MITLEDKSLHSKFVLLNSIRLAILSALELISIILLIFLENPSAVLPISLSLLAAILLSVAYFGLFGRMSTRAHVYMQLLVDILLITLLVYFTGGIISPFYFLYILPIFSSAMFLNRRDTLYVATASFIIFGFLSDLMFLNVIPFYRVSSLSTETVPPEIPLSSFIYNLIMSFIAFTSTALISSFYFEKIRKAGEELKHTQESLKDLMMINNTVMEKMENGFVTSDTGGKIISYNKKARNLLNLHKRSNIFAILSQEDRKTILEKLQASTPTHYFEKQLKQRFLGISVSMVAEVYSFEHVYVFIITDLTGKKKIEAELQRKEHFALIGEMAAGIAHEIRNPLASISGSVQFLRKKLKLQKENRNLMDIIITESNRLSKSVEEFLEFTKDTPSKLTSFDLSRVVDEIVELVKVNNPRIRFEKKYSEGYIVRGDLKKIRQLVWNLVSNAIKAVNGKGHVEVSLFDQDGHAAMAVRDDGVGMSEAEIAKIYTPFYSMFTSGIGLGMAIVRRIIDEHGFELAIQSAKNTGTEVLVVFTNRRRESADE